MDLSRHELTKDQVRVEQKLGTRRFRRNVIMQTELKTKILGLENPTAGDLP